MSIPNIRANLNDSSAIYLFKGDDLALFSPTIRRIPNTCETACGAVLKLIS